MGGVFLIAIVVVIIYNITLHQPKSRAFIIKYNSWLFTRQIKLLEKYFPYFNGLSATDKKEFLVRVNTIIKNKQFIAKEGFLVSGQMRTLIAGSHFQLTFGL